MGRMCIVEFRRINIYEEFYISNHKFRKENDKQATMLETGVVKNIYSEMPVTPADEKDSRSLMTTK
jgi:hypothetical protein